MLDRLLGAALVAGAVVQVGKRVRPLAKQAIKGYLVLVERTRELRAEATEQVQDIYAEAKAEIDDKEAEKSPAPPPKPSRRAPRSRKAKG